MVSVFYFLLAFHPLCPGVMWSHREMSDEISREGVSDGTTPPNVLFGINMHKAVKLPLTWMKKHLG